MSAFPYVITVWDGWYREVATFVDFNDALSCYGALKNETKRLVNRDRQEAETSGLTEDERQRVLEAT
jgi:hypothetical protein